MKRVSNSAARFVPFSEKALPKRVPESTAEKSRACCSGSDTVRIAATMPRWFWAIWAIDGSAAATIAMTCARVR